MNLKWRIAQAAEIRWWKRYLRKRPVTDYLERKKRYWRQVFERAGIRPEGGERVLDAGCGPAGVFIVLENCRVDGVDPLLDRYEKELSHFDPDWYPWVRFHTQRVEDFQSGAVYRRIFCLNAINHFEDLEKSLQNLAEALAPGGILYLSIDAHRSGWLKGLFQRLPGDILHPHQYDLEDYTAFAERAGLTVRKRLRLKTGRIFDYWLLEAHTKKEE